MAGHGVKPPPLNLDDVKAFDKRGLRKTETTVTNADGSRVVEGKDEEGTLYRRPSESSCHGFVVDTAEDLQVAEVEEGLIMGSQDVAHDFETLKKFGVTHILNVATGVENLFPNHFTYQTQEFRDLPEFPIFHGFEKAINFIDEGRSSGGCVLVHCNAGISRSAAIVMAYLITKNKMSVNESFSYLRSKRPPTCPNPGFLIQLQTLYESLHPKE
ncbi:dual specificity protein phosphatase 19 [Aplysia californica]|uniref:Dual specificity protein phosphatase 19 n=1 Tax=Aplysia californica TaxID=6500 RepID=A0ABM0JTH6_APLCA|nr:dual specificity protein phosphatase 19 [Aplysia californica]XP_005101101.1 dual specificity protein phosphatase 19 [Aplysia californica]XP_005101102.1 dual specificity protein phosphatase 19 [Aplysia californica]